jgi:GntR family transcriptional repressor for pyruvate dehydrogenase complex
LKIDAIERGSLKLTPVRRVRVSEAVTERILALIKKGELKPGSKLPPETELMKQFNVGRSTIREALRGLAMLGIVAARPRHGTVIVSPIDDALTEQLNSSVVYWAVRDLFEVRAVLEGYAASEAARYASSSQVEEIARAQAALEKKVARRKDYFRENQEFHAAIARAARNGVLFFCLRGIIGGLRDLRRRMHEMLPEFPERDVADHRAILGAIREGNSAKASRLMANHLRSQVRELKKMTEKGRGSIGSD